MNADCRTTAALTALADLERACDGPPPWSVVDVVLQGGAARSERLRHAAAQRQHERFAGQTRLAVARRRAAVGDGRKAEADTWLGRLVQTLATHRDTARCLHDSSVAPDPRAAGVGLELNLRHCSSLTESRLMPYHTASDGGRRRSPRLPASNQEMGS